MLSFPSRERGLKLLPMKVEGTGVRSFPSRERGLKYANAGIRGKRGGVVPLAGTWIEIDRNVGNYPLIVSFPSRERGLKLRSQKNWDFA